MLRETFFIIKNSLERNKSSLIGIALVAILLGIIPTIKSELESGIYDAASQNSHSILSLKGESFQLKILSVFGTKIDRFQSGNSADLDVPERIAKFLLYGFDSLLSILLLYLIIAALSSLISYLSERFSNKIKKDIYHSLRGFGFRKTFTVGSTIIPDKENPSGHLSSAIQRGAETVANTYSFLIEATQYLFSFAIALYAIATKSWRLSLVCLFVVIIQAIISVWQAKKLRYIREEFDEKRNTLLSKTDEVLCKREMLLAYEQEDVYSKKLDVQTESHATLDKQLGNKEALYRGLVSLTEDYGRIFVLAGALIISAVVDRESLKNSGDVYFLISIYIRLLVPATNLLRRFDDIWRSRATASTFLKIINYRDDEYQINTNGKDSTQWVRNQDIAFQNVSFSYHPDSPLTLNNATFVIPANKITLLLGPSGCGKTTVARLLLGFCRKITGAIKIGGGEINDFSGKTLRLQMSYVSQEDHIIDETIEENLIWARHGQQVSREEMLIALSTVGIDNSGGSKDLLKMNSTKLSGGQRQRISIARMMLDDPEIVIMDEPLAGVDIFTLKDLVPHLQNLLISKNQTVILISHQLHFSSIVDHIIIMSADGNIVEEGEPEELEQRNGAYANLLELSRI